MKHPVLTATTVLTLVLAATIAPTEASAAPHGRRTPADAVRLVTRSDPGTRTAGRVAASPGVVRAAGIEVALTASGPPTLVGDETVMAGDSVTYVARAVGDGLQVAAVIETVDERVQTYRFPGKHLELTSDGYVIVRVGGRTGRPVGVIDPAWAVDARGATVSSHFRVRADTLIQTSDVDRSTAFPVVADPRVRSAWYGLSVDFTRAETLALVAGGAGCEKVASKSPPGIGRAIQLSCAFLAGWAGLAAAQKKCVSAKLMNMYVWAPWITKCYA